jgi:hypothetical protein
MKKNIALLVVFYCLTIPHSVGAAQPTMPAAVAPISSGNPIMSIDQMSYADRDLYALALGVGTGVTVEEMENEIGRIFKKQILPSQKIIDEAFRTSIQKNSLEGMQFAKLLNGQKRPPSEKCIKEMTGVIKTEPGFFSKAASMYFTLPRMVIGAAKDIVNSDNPVVSKVFAAHKYVLGAATNAGAYLSDKAAENFHPLPLQKEKADMKKIYEDIIKSASSRKPRPLNMPPDKTNEEIINDSDLVKIVNNYNKDNPEYKEKLSKIKNKIREKDEKGEQDILNKALHKAIAKGSLEIVELFFIPGLKYPDQNAINDGAIEAAKYAAKNQTNSNAMEIFKLFFNQTIKPDQKGTDAAFLEGSKSNHIEFVKFLFSQTRKPDAKSVDQFFGGFFPIKGPTDVLEYLIQQGRVKQDGMDEALWQTYRGINSKDSGEKELDFLTKNGTISKFKFNEILDHASNCKDEKSLPVTFIGALISKVDRSFMDADKLEKWKKDSLQRCVELSGTDPTTEQFTHADNFKQLAVNNPALKKAVEMLEILEKVSTDGLVKGSSSGTGMPANYAGMKPEKLTQEFKKAIQQKGQSSAIRDILHCCKDKIIADDYSGHIKQMIINDDLPSLEILFEKGFIEKGDNLDKYIATSAQHNNLDILSFLLTKQDLTKDLAGEVFDTISRTPEDRNIKLEILKLIFNQFSPSNAKKLMKDCFIRAAKDDRKAGIEMLLAIEIDGLDQEIFKGALAAALSSKPKRDDEKKDNLDIIKIIAEKRSELGVDSLYEDLETAKTLGRKDCEEFFKELIAAAGAEIPVKDSDGETEEEENSSIETEETEEAENPDGETEEENE